jgi:hypothetical protein
MAVIIMVLFTILTALRLQELLIPTEIILTVPITATALTILKLPHRKLKPVVVLCR